MDPLSQQGVDLGGIPQAKAIHNINGEKIVGESLLFLWLLGSYLEKETKAKVFQAMSGSEVACNKDGDLGLQQRTFPCLDDRDTMAPLKNGG